MHDSERKLALQDGTWTTFRKIHYRTFLPREADAIAKFIVFVSPGLVVWAGACRCRHEVKPPSQQLFVS